MFNFKTIVFALFLGINLSWSAVWPLEPVELFLQTSGTYFRTSNYFDTEGTSQTTPTTQNLTLSTYGELGIVSHVSLTWNIAFYRVLNTQGSIEVDNVNRVIRESNTNLTVSGLSDTEIGFKFGIWRTKNLAFAVGLSLGIPGNKFQSSQEESEIDRLLNENPTFEGVRASTGFESVVPIGFDDFPVKAIVRGQYSLPLNSFVVSVVDFSLGAGYQIRGRGFVSEAIGTLPGSNNYSDVGILEASIGASFFQRIYLILGWANYQLLDTEKLGTFDSQYAVVSTQAYVNIISQFGFLLGTEASYNNRNTFQTFVYKFGLFLNI